MDYVLREPESGGPSELILLLHGYGESGGSLLRRLQAALPPEALVLAPNAPFPFAEKTEERYRMAYSWYFYDFQTDEYVIDMKTSLGFLATGIEKLGYSSLPLRIIGFSQGGYLAPFVGERLARTRQVIGLHSTYLHEELAPALGFRADNIVGALDTVVDPESSRRSHAQILKRSRGGAFFSLEGVGHRIDEAVVRKTAELLQCTEA